MNTIYFLKINPKTDTTNRIQLKEYCSKMGKLIVKNIARSLLGAKEETLVFESYEKGKPYFKNYPHFHFNISHSDNAVTVVVCDGAVGIDCEKIQKANPKLAKRFFTEKENAYINENPLESDTRFFEIWTKKEAFLKLSGKGITIPLDSFDVTDGSLNESFYTIKKGEVVISVCTHCPTDFAFSEISEEDIPNL